MKRKAPKTFGNDVENHWGLVVNSLKKAIRGIIIGGVLFGSILMNHISVNANQSGYREIDYQDGIPEDIRVYCELVGNEYNISPELLEAIAYNESRFIPTVKNGKHYGLMQINVKIHSFRLEEYGFTEDDMFDPYKNLIIAADYISDLYENYADEDEVMLALYSGNWKAVSNYKEYGFVCSYAQTILNRAEKYKEMHE